MTTTQPPDDGSLNREEILATMKRIEEQEQKLLAGWQTSIDLNDANSSTDEERLDPDIASLLDNAEDPPLNKRLWHNAQSAIIKNIPKGNTRRFVLDEKGLFLRASSSTTDQKFTFKTPAQIVYDIVESWVRSRGDAIELGMSLWDLNEENGFHKKKRKSKATAQATS